MSSPDGQKPFRCSTLNVDNSKSRDTSEPIHRYTTCYLFTGTSKLKGEYPTHRTLISGQENNVA